MIEVQTIGGYIFGFGALYVQVLFLVALLRARKDLVHGTVIPDNVDWPVVTIMVPCWNEEDTVVETIDSLLDVDYPKDKLIVQIIDDGSTDQTWERARKFEGISNIQLIHKENGGKHTAMNMAIEQATTEFIGNLDADTFLGKDTLKKTMWQFIQDPDMMAVSPAVVINKPKGFLGKAQEVEFNMFILIKKAMAVINGIHVTQGQFSMYRKKVFDDLGGYHKAHQTEDLEVAFRMQAHGYKIGQCHDAFVYTTPMDTFSTLFKQRLRWVYGFINNTYDYRKYIFKPKHGSFSMFSVPAGIFYIFSILFGTIIAIWGIGAAIVHFVSRMLATNFYWGHTSSNLFFIDTRPILFLSIFLFLILIGMVSMSKRIQGQRPTPPLALISFFILFNFVASTWLIKAIYNTIITKEVNWR